MKKESDKRNEMADRYENAVSNIKGLKGGKPTKAANARKSKTSNSELSKSQMKLKSHHLGVGKTHMLKATQDERPYRVYTIPISCCCWLLVALVLNFSL